MEKKTHWKKSNQYLKNMLLPLLIFLLLLCLFYLGISQAQAVADHENRKVLEQAVLRATVQCYAIEGMYPPNVAYLEENYGVIIDKKIYIVHYEAFATNILPSITVLEKVGS
ncbi:MAG: hypothetical protein WCI30_06910 [Clostridia bacterium]